MAVTLTTAELATLTSMEAQAQAHRIGFWQIYQWLGELLQAKGVSATDSTLLWLKGATEANAGQGAFSELIRSYTEAQYQLRYGTAIPFGKMQEASNAVAQNLIDDLLGRNESKGWPKGQVPDIARIATNDATAVGDVLFKVAGDTSAPPTNSAWSGALLFSLLRSDQTVRLTSTGSAGVLDTLNDLRDVLYSFSAYAKGWSAARDVFLVNSLAAAGGSVEASKQVGIDTQVMGATFVGYFQGGGSWTSLTQSIRLGTSGVVGEAFIRIGEIGPNRFLDMVLGAAQGKPLIGTTTDANFSVKAKEFFGKRSMNPALATASVTGQEPLRPQPS